MEPLGGGYVIRVEPLWTGLVPGWKRPPRAPLPSAMWGHRMNLTVYEPGSIYSPDTKSSILYILDFPASDLWEILACCVNHPVYWIFVIAAWID